MKKEAFLKWAKGLIIESKDKGRMSFAPSNWFGTQKYLIDRIFNTIEKNPNKRTFVILKGRQEGITTIANALDLFYVMYHNSMSAAILSSDIKVENNMRMTIYSYYQNLSKKYKIPYTAKNRENLILANKSKLTFFHLAKREKEQSNLGVSYGINYLHATEVSRYPNIDDFNTFVSTLSEEYENRLYILESTAYGYNSFYDMWETAKESETQEAIFVGWWLKETYRIDPETNPYDFKKYGYPPEDWEKEKIEEVKALYGYDLTIEQLAWWRKYMNEKMVSGNMSQFDTMLQEYPFTENDAFRMSGNKFFDDKLIAEKRKLTIAPKITLEPLFKDSPEETKFKEVKGGSIKIWELYDPTAKYVTACDPAAGENGDNFVIQTYKVFNDKMYQVLEYVANNVKLPFATWIVISIAGMYRSHYILEVNGLGKAVLQMIDAYKTNIIKKLKQNESIDPQLSIFYFAKLIQDEYIYRRVDSFGISGARHWVTTYELKEKIMYQLQGFVSQGSMIIRSDKLLKEMQYIEKSNSNFGAVSGKNDDRVMCAAMAAELWLQVRSNLMLEEEWNKRQAEIAKKIEQQKNPRVIPFDRLIQWKKKNLNR
ncbi:MAG: hypothetical protein QXI16_00260 [Sulfolobaceae archaeon]